MSNRKVAPHIRVMRLCKNYTDAFINQLLDFGIITGSRTASANSSTEVSIEGLPSAEDDNSSETYPNAEVWDHPAVLWRPTDGCELLFWRRGSELICIAGKERRWQVALSEGEVVVRGLAADSGKITFRADGTIEITPGTGLEAIVGSGTSYVALASLVAVELANIATALTTHVHTGVTTGAGTSGVAAPVYTPGSVQSGNLKAD